MTQKYDCAALTVAYSFTFNGDYFLYLNNGVNNDNIFLVKEKNNNEASWRIWKVYHKKLAILIGDYNKGSKKFRDKMKNKF